MIVLTSILTCTLMALAPADAPNASPTPPPAGTPATSDVHDILPPASVQSGAYESAVREARKLLDAGKAADAAALYEEAVRARPDSAEATYNLGLARYREGKFTEASAAFARAAALSSQGTNTNSRLTTDSLYNKAAGFYGSTREQAEAAQKALKQRDANPDQPTPDLSGVNTEALKQAIKDARSSLQGFKDAAIADPNDRDARANAEQSNRLVRALEELEKMQQQQQEQQQNQQQSKDQKNQDKQDKKDQQDQQQQNEQQKDQQEQSEDQQQKDQQQNQDQQQKQQNKDNPSEQEEGQKDQQSQEQKDEEERKKEEQKKQEAQAKEEEQRKEQEEQKKQGEQKRDPSKDNQQPKDGQEGTKEMTQDEAGRLLQAVRDAEKKRRAQLEAREAQRQAKTRPPVKDW